MRKLTIIFLLILFSVGCGPSGNQPEPKPQPPEDTEPFQASLQIYLEGERADDAPQALLLDINKLEICGGRGCLELAINKIVDLYEEVPSAATLELTKIEEYLEPTSEGNQKLRVESLGIYLGDQNSVTFNGKEHLIKLAPEKEILLLEDISSLTKGHSVINILVRPTLLTESSSVVPLQDAPTYELDFDINLVFCKVSSSMQKITPNTTVAGLDGLTVYSKPEHILKYGVFKYGALFGGFIERGKFAYSNTYYLTYCPYLLSQQTDQLENFVVSIPLKQPVQGDIAILANKMSFLTTARRNNKLEARLSDIPELISRFTQTSEAPQANIAILRAAVKGEQNVYSRNLRIPYESNGVIYREMLVGSSQLHVVEVPLNTAQYEIQILSDQTQAGERIPLRTVKQLVAESAKKGTTVAINAGPWEDNNPPWQPTGQKDNDKGLDFSWTTVISGIVRQHQNADGKDQVLLGMDYTDSKNQFEVVSIKKKNIDQVFGEKLFTLSDGKPSHIQGSTTSILLLKKNKENKRFQN